MATLEQYSDEQLLGYALECKQECTDTPVGVLGLLVELARRNLKHGKEIERLKFPFGTAPGLGPQ